VPQSKKVQNITVIGYLLFCELGPTRCICINFKLRFELVIEGCQHRLRRASALAPRMTTLSSFAEKVRYGLLMSYGPDVAEFLRKAAVYLYKILRGVKPDDFPVEQPTRLKLAIKTHHCSMLAQIAFEQEDFQSAGLA
jgi:hypothetical protein